MKTLFVNGKKLKVKMKKNAEDPVDIEEEKKKDPKYKTELCKSFMEQGYCVYGNICRFAHGQKELVAKTGGSNYKKKPCKSFIEQGFCPYGSRCNFKHEERTLSEINLPYFYVNLFIRNEIVHGRRLKVFQEITNEYNKCSGRNENNSSFDSTNSNDDNNFIQMNNIKPKKQKFN